jgi:uncharacterized protein (DUF433 family)
MMNTAIWDRVEVRDGEAVVRSTGAPISHVVGALEDGRSPREVVKSLALEPADLIAVLAHDALGEGDGPTLVQTSPRRPRLAPALSEGALAELYPKASRPARLALSAGLLQIHDFWDASHHAAQEADDLGEAHVSAYWHGIAHRREPDAGNAGYWFRRVGRHGVFGPLADAARPVLANDPSGPTIGARLMPSGTWDPFAFIDLCTGRASAHAAIARKLQRLEMILLLEVSLPA